MERGLLPFALREKGLGVEGLVQNRDLLSLIRMANDTVFAEYVQDRARKSGQDAAKIAAEINGEEFYDLIYALHERFMAGEFSLGYMAKRLEITKPDIYHLLDAMGLKVTNI